MSENFGLRLAQCSLAGGCTLINGKKIAVVMPAFNAEKTLELTAREREIGTLEQIMVTPIRPVEFILGKTLPFFLIGLFDAMLIGAVGTFWF